MIKFTDIENGNLKEEEKVKSSCFSAEVISRNDSQQTCSQTNKEKELHQHTQIHTNQINRQRGGADRRSASADTYPNEFSDKRVRLRFIKNVYACLSLMLVISFGIILFCYFCDPVYFFLLENPYFGYIFFGIYIVSMVYLTCFGGFRRYPTNYIILFIMICSFSIFKAFVVVHYSVPSVFIALGTALLIAVFISVLAWLCPIDLNNCGCWFFLVLSAIGTFCSIAWLLNVLWLRMPILQTVISGLLLVLFIIYLLYDTQAILRGRGNEIGPYDYLSGAMHLYIDIMYIFVLLLGISE